MNIAHPGNFFSDFNLGCIALIIGKHSLQSFQNAIIVHLLDNKRQQRIAIGSGIAINQHVNLQPKPDVLIKTSCLIGLYRQFLQLAQQGSLYLKIFLLLFSVAGNSPMDNSCFSFASPERKSLQTFKPRTFRFSAPKLGYHVTLTAKVSQDQKLPQLFCKQTVTHTCKFF